MPAKPEQDAQKNVGIWIRVSTEDQARGESPAVHEKRARLYAEARDWIVREVYRLEAVSGKAVLGHPEAQRMLADLKSGRITGLVFSKLARLARNTKELIELSEEFRKYDADLISLAESLDTGSPAGRFFFTVMGAMAQWEREEIASRVAASVPIRAKLGKPIGGQAPFGYRWRGKKLVVDPNEAPIAKLMFELFAEHKRRKTVAKLLNDRGYRTRNGSKWSDTTVLRLIENPVFKGKHRANYTRTDDRTGAWELKPESEWVYNDVEPIVAKEIWEGCNSVLAAAHRPRKRQARKVVHLFAGIVHCACGAKMYVWSNSPKYVCTKCKNKIAVADLEAIYRERVGEYLVSPEAIEAHFTAADDAIREKTKLVEAAEAELKKIATAADRVYRAYIEDRISAAEYGRRHKPLEDRRAQLEEELPRVQAELDVLRINTVSLTDAIAEAQSLAKRWPKISQEDRREIIEAITDRIVIEKDSVAIELLYEPSGPPGPPSNCNNKATKGHGFIAATSWKRAG